MQNQSYNLGAKNVLYYFIYNGKQMGQGTKVRFNYDFYHRNAAGNLFACYQYAIPKPSIFSHIRHEDGKTIWFFNNCIVDDLVLDRDVETIVEYVPYVEKTDKDKILEKKKKGVTWEYIWPGTIIYILSILLVSLFNERLWGWIAVTILYMNYYYEQLSK
jgi:hypothetical protein